MLPSIQCLETIIPPRDKRRSVGIRLVRILFSQPVESIIPVLTIESTSERSHVGTATKCFVVTAIEKRNSEIIPTHNVRYCVVEIFVKVAFSRRVAWNSRIQSIGQLLTGNHNEDEKNCRERRCSPNSLSSTCNTVRRSTDSSTTPCSNESVPT